MHAPKGSHPPDLFTPYSPQDLPGRLAAAQRLTSPGKTAQPATLLVAEEDEQVRGAFGAALDRQGYEVICAASAGDAAAWLSRRPFDILLCSISLPPQNGLDLYTQSTEQFPDMIVILVTGPGPERTRREEAYFGAVDFVAATCGPAELATIVERNLARRMLQRKHALRYRIAPETSHESVLDALLTALNTKDTEPEGHCERVTGYTMEIADGMAVAPGLRYHIERGALLHDIGKIGVPDNILHKPDRLTTEEWMEMRKHPVLGYQMCAKIDLLKPASQIVLHHHEKWDGSGYPYGLGGEAIPLGCRIFAVADALDAMTSDRPYRKKISFTAARQEILKGAGSQFDPAIARAFLAIPESRLIFIQSNAAP